MEILKLLKKDHTEVKTLLKEIKKALDDDDVNEIRNLFHDLKRNVVGHSKAEEQVLYDRMENLEDEKARMMAYESAEEHSLAESLLNRMDTDEVTGDKWCGQFMVLREMLMNHIKEEESDLFALARKNFDKDQLLDFGEEFQTEKERVLGGVTEEEGPVYSEEERAGLQ